ncbi:MAG: tRNA (5-methylaminomethyl-2-thiouridine)(34)-methyltransferase MnmD [Cytophagales bacterium]|nr:tRNA (5-methylaminomethyl-2-thiouridine)(34)-methyltransferase MnmD [Cytophagales bacterium]
MSKRKFLITADGSHTLFIPELDETYHSVHGAIQESRYVFIDQGLDFFVRLKCVKSIKVFEVGFGTGLNALLAALYSNDRQVKVSYQSIEAFPLTEKEIIQLNYPTLIDHKSSGALFQKIHHGLWETWNDISAYFRLSKINKKIQDFDPGKCDVCFYDAFAPSKQPDMWKKDVLAKICKALTDNGVFITYCAKGQLKRDLKALGFEVESLKGPPGKKEMVRAIKI